MKRSTKRLVVLALAMALVFTLVACGKKEDPAQKETNEENAEETHTISPGLFFSALHKDDRTQAKGRVTLGLNKTLFG